MSRGEAALVLGVAKHTVRKWQRRGLLKAEYHNSKVIRYDPNQVNQLKPLVGTRCNRKMPQL